MQCTNIARQRIITAWPRITILKQRSTTKRAIINRLRITRIWRTRITSTRVSTLNMRRSII